MYATTTVYDDADADQIETLAPTQPHRHVDLEIINADKQGVLDIVDIQGVALLI